MNWCVRSAALALLVVVGIPSDAAPQGSTGALVRSADVTSVTSPIAIDGSLNEPAWTRRRKSATSCSASRVTGARRPSAPTSRCCATRTISTSASSPTIRSRIGHRDADGARRRSLECRRSHRNPPRHVPRPAKRVLLRDEPLGRARGRPDVRRRPAQYRVGRHLAGAGRAHRGADGWRNSPFRSRASASPPGGSSGGSTSRGTSPQARGRPLVGRAPRHAVSSGVRGRRDHESRRAHARHRPGPASVPRRELAAPRAESATIRCTGGPGSTSSTTSRRA